MCFQFFIHACLRALVIRERACACTSRCVYVSLVNYQFVLVHLALMMDLSVFAILSYMHAFVHSSYVFVVLSSPDDGFVVFQFFIHACLHALVIRERACACTSRCVYVCCINNKFVLFHLAQMMDLCVFYNFSYMHAFVHSSYVNERMLA